MGAGPFAWQRAGPGDQQAFPLDLDAHRFRSNPWQRRNNPKLLLGFEDIDRRLPAGGVLALARRLEELAVKMLGLLEQGASLGPHLMFRVTHYHRLES